MNRNCSDVHKMWLDNAPQQIANTVRLPIANTVRLRDIGMLVGIIGRRLGAAEQLHDFMIGPSA